MLEWDQYKFIECLGVLPELDEEYETNHVFRVEKDGLRFILTIYQYSGDVYFDCSVMVLTRQSLRSSSWIALVLLT